MADDEALDRIETRAFALIERIGIPLANSMTAFYEAKLSNSDSVEQWEEQGSKDAARRAHDRWNLLLNTYEAPPIDPGTLDALHDFVARRKAELPDAWY